MSKNKNGQPSGDASRDAAIVDQVFAAARAIPPGKVLSYGDLGAQCEPPISGYICGRIMGNVADDVPWWRVLAKDGSLPISKRNPELAAQQRARLEAEGVPFDEHGRVVIEQCRAAMKQTGTASKSLSLFED